MRVLKGKIALKFEGILIYIDKGIRLNEAVHHFYFSRSEQLVPWKRRGYAAVACLPHAPCQIIESTSYGIPASFH